ncbi:AAA domain-containing protein [Nitrosomonas aestuarii]|uniref:AAA domain-containing protein n=1 Tax=Nitrosomonas aestuarii TaxID=52441 RepID=A0A1I4B6N8_9PROT|nr:AAA family ATPase [Nitrosomonas aestuarii]SFK64528.1 AAA domain-containing protein [Nitrosomonas aestuarii]
MNINSIEINHFLGVKDVAIEPATPITLIAGDNGAGKSSIRDAIKMALTGESSRIALKKDYRALVSGDQKSGFAEIKSGDDSYSIVLPSGKGNHLDHSGLIYALEGQRFADMTEKERRSYLASLTGQSMNHHDICKKLVDLGCNEEKVERIKSMLRAGFDAAQKEAAGHAKEAKGGWKTATSGETWGVDKGSKWEPEVPTTPVKDAADIVLNSQKRIDELEVELKQKTESLGAANQAAKHAENSAENREKLEKQAAGIERLQHKLEADIRNLEKCEDEIAQIKAAQSRVSDPDPLLVSLKNAASEVVSIVDTTKGVADADLNIHDWSKYKDLIMRLHTCISDFETLCAPVNSGLREGAKISDYEISLRLMRNSVTNGHRDIALAEEAKKKLEALEDETGVDKADAASIEEEIAEINRKINYWQDDVRTHQAIVDAHNKRSQVIEQAKKLHQDIVEWIAISDALSPTGIPGEIISEAVAPINERLLDTAASSWMLRAAIESDMSITATKQNGKKTPYALLSKSEQWRVNAMIAEAIAHVTGSKILILDELDILSPKNRGPLIKWLNTVVKQGDIDTVILFATLKEPPRKFPASITTHWIEDGELIPQEQWYDMFPSWKEQFIANPGKAA